MRSPREYALVIVKPDGVRDNRTKEVLDFFQSRGMRYIKSISKKATKATVDLIFTSKHKGAFYKRYMTSGEMVACLMEGENGFDHCRIIKNELRKQYGVENEIENICHTPEAGNEYVQQLSFFFPELCNGMYQLYCDAYCKVYASLDYEYMKECLNTYKKETNSRLIFIFGNEEMHEYRKCITRFYLEDNAENDFFGVEYLVALGRERLRIIGYYHINVLKDFQCENVYIYRDVFEVLEMIVGNNGMPVWGYSNKIDAALDYFDKYPLNGVIVYHPMYTIKETEILREYAEKHGMLTLGGSGGAHPGECSISSALFRRFETSGIWEDSKEQE